MLPRFHHPPRLHQLRRHFARQGSNKRGIAREKPEKAKPPGTKSVTQKRTRRRGQVKKATKATKATKAKAAKVAKKANGRKRGAR